MEKDILVTFKRFVLSFFSEVQRSLETQRTQQCFHCWLTLLWKSRNYPGLWSRDLSLSLGFLSLVWYSSFYRKRLLWTNPLKNTGREGVEAWSNIMGLPVQRLLLHGKSLISTKVFQVCFRSSAYPSSGRVAGALWWTHSGWLSAPW